MTLGYMSGALSDCFFRPLYLRRRGLVDVPMRLLGSGATVPPNLDSTQLDGSRALAVSAGNRTLGSVRYACLKPGGPRVLDQVNGR